MAYWYTVAKAGVVESSIPELGSVHATGKTFQGFSGCQLSLVLEGRGWS